MEILIILEEDSKRKRLIEIINLSDFSVGFVETIIYVKTILLYFTLVSTDSIRAEIHFSGR